MKRALSPLKTAWHKWLAVAKIIGNFQARVLLTLFYFLLVTWMALPFRLFSDPLRIKRGSTRTSWWRPRAEGHSSVQAATRQS